jgi:hypothetical protein
MAEPPESVGYVFISYAREDASNALELKRAFEIHGIKVWLDKTDLWPGEDWRAKIRRVITDNALLFIACFSKASASRDVGYQNEELNLAIEQLRSRKPATPWLIPVRFDDCDIPDLDIGGGRTLRSIQRADLYGEEFVDQMKRLIEIAQRILGLVTATGATDQPCEVKDEQDLAILFRSWPGVPKTQSDLDNIIKNKPPYWEYLLFAGTLKLEMEKLETRYEDFLLGYAPRTSVIIHDREFAEYLNIQLTELTVIAESYIRLCDKEAVERAFGEKGISGDVSRIMHLAKRHISVYDELLRWAERLRGASIPSRYRKLVDILLENPKQPLDELRRFVEGYAERTEEFPNLAQKGQPIRLEHRITWIWPDSQVKSYKDEIDRLRTAR